jgi:hypothetical protein
LFLQFFFCLSLYFAISDDTFKMFVPFDATVISLDSATEDHDSSFLCTGFVFFLPRDGFFCLGTVNDETFKMFVPFDTTMISLDSSAEDHVLFFFFLVGTFVPWTGYFFYFGSWSVMRRSRCSYHLIQP